MSYDEYGRFRGCFLLRHQISNLNVDISTLTE